MLEDDDLDKLLARATQLNPSQGYEARLMARLPNNVVALTQRQKPNYWLIGLPLAASLMLGIWLGASNRLENIIPIGGTEFAISDGTVEADDLDAVMEDQQS